ncbi:MAG: hypothetical protein JO100_17645 [Pseudonocardia sp.]|nr:hypothetical protein [Pseudonocardia sp.]
MLANAITPQREKAAVREGHWRSLRFSYQTYLRGLAIALRRRIDERLILDWARQAATIALRLRHHPATDTYLAARSRRRADGRPLHYDGALVDLLLTIAEGLVMAVTSTPELSWAADHAAESVAELTRYVELVEHQDLPKPTRIPPNYRRRITEITPVEHFHRSDGSRLARANERRSLNSRFTRVLPFHVHEHHGS